MFGTCLDYYFKATVELQYKQKVWSIDFGQQSFIQTTAMLRTFKQCTLTQMLAIAVGSLTTSSRTAPKTRPWTNILNIGQAILHIIHLINPHTQIVNCFKPLQIFSCLLDHLSLVIVFTNSDMVPNQTRHNTHQNISRNRHEKSPVTETRFRQRHVRTNTIEETESSDPWVFWGRGGGYQVNHIEEP